MNCSHPQRICSLKQKYRSREIDAGSILPKYEGVFVIFWILSVIEDSVAADIVLGSMYRSNVYLFNANSVQPYMPVFRLIFKFTDYFKNIVVNKITVTAVNS
jgi:hypothetical protein